MRTPPRALYLLVPIALIVGCSFDQTGLGNAPVMDAPQGTADAPAAVTPDAPPGGSGADARVADAPPTTPDGSPYVGVSCGTMTCTGTDVCCVPGFGGGNTGATCAAQCGPGESTFACDGPEDCSGGQVCCMSRGGSSCTDPDSCGGIGGGSVACRTANDCQSGGDQCCPLQGTSVSVCAQVCF
jgi:hypothetical protein